MPPVTLGTLNGIVTAFDDERGLGEIVADDTTYPFHCTAIDDGSRSIEVGTPVRFAVAAGRSGRWEAASIERT